MIIGHVDVVDLRGFSGKRYVRFVVGHGEPRIVDSDDPSAWSTHAEMAAAGVHQ